jgi:RNA polymerase sigma-70 factor (ECF subfamily)
MQADENVAEAKDSFEAQALPHLNDLFRAATSILGNRTEAEDVAQEVYLQAWKSFHRFTPGTNCRAWLFGILFHVIHHHRRKWFKLTLMADNEEMFAETLAYEPPVPQHLSDEDMLRAFKQIPQQFAEVVMLADVYEFSYKEVHEALGIPIGTVMSRLNRGRRLLRGHLANFAPAAEAQSQAVHAV